AGMEWDLRDPNAPYIVKSPWICDYLEEALANGDICIDHALVPVRDLYSAAQSRREVSARTDAAGFPNGVPGGLWHTDNPDRQEIILAGQLYKLIHTLAKRDIPTSFIYFTRMIHDPEYLYTKVAFLTGGASFDKFHAAFRQVVKPHLVHEFEPR